MIKTNKFIRSRLCKQLLFIDTSVIEMLCSSCLVMFAMQVLMHRGVGGHAHMMTDTLLPSLEGRNYFL